MPPAPRPRPARGSRARARGTPPRPRSAPPAAGCAAAARRHLLLQRADLLAQAAAGTCAGAPPHGGSAVPRRRRRSSGGGGVPSPSHDGGPYGRVPREGRHDPARAAAEGGRAGGQRRRRETPARLAGGAVNGEVEARRGRQLRPGDVVPSVMRRGFASREHPRRLRDGLRAGERQVGRRARGAVSCSRGASTRLGVFRPVVADAEQDPMVDLLRLRRDSCPTRRRAA